MTAISPQQTETESTESNETAQTSQGARQLSAMFFLNIASLGWVAPFISLYMVTLGFSATEIGFVVSAYALVNIIASPILNNYADRTGQHRRLFVGLIVTMSLAAIGLAAPISEFWIVLMIILWRGASVPLIALQAQLTITWLQLRQRDIFGRVRAVGSLGWTMSTFTAGTVLAIGGYPLMFVLSGLINLLILPLARMMPKDTNTNRVQKDTGSGASRQKGFYIFMAASFAFYIGRSTYFAFGFVYMEQGLGASVGMIGFLVGMTALSEVLPMILMDRVLKRVDVRLTMAAGMIAPAITFIVLALMDDTTWILPLMIFHGLAQTLTIISAPLLVSEISHPANLARNQSLAGATMNGSAAFIAGPIMGIIFDTVGGGEVLLIAGTISFAAGVALIIMRRYLVPPPGIIQPDAG